MGLYFNNLSTWVLYHASYLFLIILIRDVVKDLQNFKGDWVRGYQTTAVVFGERSTKYILSFLSFMALAVVALLLAQKDQLGGMYYYFLFVYPRYYYSFLSCGSRSRKSCIFGSTTG